MYTRAIVQAQAYIKSKNCNPVIVRLAWHDAGTYDKVSSLGQSH